MRRLGVVTAVVVGLGLSLSTQALADKPEGKGKDKSWKAAKQKKAERAEPEENSALLRALTDSEQQELADLILDKEYGFSKNSVPKEGSKQLPPGLQKKLARGGSLPPGWQNKLQRGEVLDREVYREA